MLHAVCASILWGLFPLYFKLLKEIPSISSCTGCSGRACSWWRCWPGAGNGLGGRGHQAAHGGAGFLLSALLLSGNWTLYVWAVNAGRIVDTSLGYFMSPLMSVFMGYLILKERMRPLQWLAVLLALGAVPG
jgi:chloramphenicol-sensitive protein RarD